MAVGDSSPLPRPVVDAAVSVGVETSATAWDDYVRRHADATVDHLWSWQRIFRDVFGHESVYLSARADDRIVGVLPLVLFRSRLFGRGVVSLPFLNYGGVLADDEGVVRRLVERASQAADEFGASHVELRHERRLCPDLPFTQCKLALRRALPGSVDDLWKDTDRKVRNQVRKAQKENLVAASGGAELVDEFYGVFSENMRDLGTPVYSKRLFSETLAAFPGDARVFVVRRDGQTLAASIAIRFRHTVLVPWASSLRTFRHLCPNMLLYWSMLEHAVTSDARVFDFGRSSVGAGTHQFKLQWGATESPLSWEYVLLGSSTVPDHGPGNPKFQAAIRAWQHCPLWIANALGPHIVREIP